MSLANASQSLLRLPTLPPACLGECQSKFTQPARQPACSPAHRPGKHCPLWPRHSRQEQVGTLKLTFLHEKSTKTITTARPHCGEVYPGKTQSPAWLTLTPLGRTQAEASLRGPARANTSRSLLSGHTSPE